MVLATPNAEWRIKRWLKVDGRLKPGEPPFILEFEFDDPVIDLRHGELLGKGYESVEQALQDGINKEDVRRALAGGNVRTQVRVAEWDTKSPTAATGNRVPRDEEDELEAMIDRHGLAAVLESLEEIANGKAEHLSENWQDERSARVWERARDAMLRATDKIRELGV